MDHGSQEALIAYLDSPSFLEASSNATRLVGKLKASIEEKELYETHQIFRTIYFRFSNHEEKLAPLIDLLYHGALYLLKFEEFISGQDIAVLLLETAAKCLKTYREDGGQEARLNLVYSSLNHHRKTNTFDLSICEKVADIAISLPDTELGQPKFVAETLKILSPKLLNRDLLHDALATRYWQQKKYSSARYHYLHCANLENADRIASLLIEYHSNCASRNEVDLFIAQFIFQFLCLQRPLDPAEITGSGSPGQGASGSSGHPTNKSAHMLCKSAVSHKTRTTIKLISEKIFDTYTRTHPLLRQNRISLPLFNFTRFIISLSDGSPPVTKAWLGFRETYKACWTRDPSYHNYLERIGLLYFGYIDPARQQQQQQLQSNYFRNMLTSLIDSYEDDDEGGTEENGTAEEEEEERNSNRRGNTVSSCDELD